MFKKTLIAAAVATLASSVAMADVTVSGQVKYTLTDTANSTSDWNPSSDNAITVKSSEDLGNGLTAFAQITLDTDSPASTTSTTASIDGTDVSDTNTQSVEATSHALQKDAKLGIKGGFGTLVMGRMEYLVEGAFSSKMDDGSGKTESNQITGFDRANAVAYVSPTVNGLHVAAAGSNDAAADMFTNKEVLAVYSNGALSVMASHVDVKDTQAMNSLYASYAIGDAKISAMTVDTDYDAAATTDLRDNIIRLDYTMGNNSLLIINKDADAANADRTAVKLTHKFSKRTAAYVGVRNNDGTTEDETYVGMITKF
jgi:predicted porin